MDLNFYSTGQEQDQLLHWALNAGAALVPDVHYDEPHVMTITATAQLAGCGKTVQFCVVHPDWQVEPLHMRPYVHRTKGGGFYISQRDGGPSILLALYRAGCVDDRADGLFAGMVATFPFYYSTSSAVRITPNAAYRNFAKRMANEIRRGGRSLKIENQVSWLTAGAWANAQRDLGELPPALRTAARVALG